MDLIEEDLRDKLREIAGLTVDIFDSEKDIKTVRRERARIKRQSLSQFYRFIELQRGGVRLE